MRARTAAARSRTQDLGDRHAPAGGGGAAAVFASARGSRGARRRDVGRGSAEVGALRRTRRCGHSGNGEPRARASERTRRLAAVVRRGATTACGTLRRLKPDSARTVYDGKLFDVTVERWGEHEREIVEHPGAVAIVAVDAADRVTLVRQLREPARKELLELPAGTLEEGEGPLATAKRGPEEETGLRGGSW